MQAMKWIPQLFTTDGRLLRNQSKLMEIAPEAIFEVLKPAAIEGYRLAFVVLRDVASFDCPAALEQFLACYLDLVRLEGLHGDSASDNRSLVAVSTQLTVIHQKLGRQIVTAEVRRCAETLDVWLRRYQIGERLGDKFAKAWTATCRTLQCRSEHDNHDNLD